MVCYAQVAAKLCLQNGIELVGVCSGRSSGSDSGNFNGELAELEGGNEEPNGGSKIRMNNKGRIF